MTAKLLSLNQPDSCRHKYCLKKHLHPPYTKLEQETGVRTRDIQPGNTERLCIGLMSQVLYKTLVDIEEKKHAHIPKPEINRCICHFDLLRAADTDNIISDNLATGHERTRWGGIYCHGSHVTITGNQILRNWTDVEYGCGGGLPCLDVGIWVGSAVVENNVISENNTLGVWASEGGFYSDQSMFMMSGYMINGNTTSDYFDAGGGVYCVGYGSE
ncbi:MAG: right-handed parallel beta-helix repeat-containing protein [Planctomycetes bacterium]|nr:right-handed parallel beta-helix repeat-containing protein [Planctomycetota bacterium]